MLSRVRGSATDRRSLGDLGGPSPLSHRPRYAGITQHGSGDIYVTVKGVKRSGKVSRATIGRRLPWFRHRQSTPRNNFLRILTGLLRALHYLHKCNRRARVCCAADASAPAKRCLLRVASCRLPSWHCRGIESFDLRRCARFLIVAREMSVELSRYQPSISQWDLFFSSESLTNYYYRSNFLIFHIGRFFN